LRRVHTWEMHRRRTLSCMFLRAKSNASTAQSRCKGNILGGRACAQVLVGRAAANPFVHLNEPCVGEQRNASETPGPVQPQRAATPAVVRGFEDRRRGVERVLCRRRLPQVNHAQNAVDAARCPAGLLPRHLNLRDFPFSASCDLIMRKPMGAGGRLTGVVCSQESVNYVRTPLRMWQGRRHQPQPAAW